MGIDLSKLAPAPWSVGLAPEEPTPTYLIGSRSMLWASVVSTPGRDSGVDAVFIALARNAFDVMMRRGWWPQHFGNVGGWSVASECLDREKRKAGVVAWDLAKWCDEQKWTDPFTAMVEADAWYRANVEKVS